MGDHAWRLSCLSALQVVAEGGAVMIALRRLHEHMATVTVAGLRDRAAARAVAARVFACDEAEIRGQLGGPCEPAPIHQFGGEHHRVLERDPAKNIATV